MFFMLRLQIQRKNVCSYISWMLSCKFHYIHVSKQDSRREQWGSSNICKYHEQKEQKMNRDDSTWYRNRHLGRSRREDSSKCVRARITLIPCEVSRRDQRTWTDMSKETLNEWEKKWKNESWLYFGWDYLFI